MTHDRRIAWGLFWLAWVAFGWFYGGAGWNQDAQFDLARALVERQTLYIDGYDVNTGDVSRGVGGRVYINKAPGVSFLAAVPYAGVYLIERAAGVSPDRVAAVNAWIVTAFTCGLAGALIGPILYVHARRRLRVDALTAVMVTCAILFGTIVFPYATMLFAHVPAALFCLIAVTTWKERPFLAGIAAGLALTCFYLCAIVAVVLAIVAGRRALSFLAGFAPFAIALGVYHWICFGSPFRTAVEASSGFTDPSRILGVFGAIAPEALWGLTLSPYRGLFFASPALLLALAGIRREIAIFVSSAAFLLAVAAFNGWNGGWAFGPRYLLPIVPLLAIPMFVAFARASRVSRAIWIAAIAISIGVNFIATATDAMPSPELRNPVVRYHLPAFFTGRIPEETRAAFPWYGSTEVEHVALPRDAANLGELVFGAGTRASVLPVANWLAGGIAILLKNARRETLAS